MQNNTVIILESLTLHPKHRSKYVRLRLSNERLYIEGSIDDDKCAWADLGFEKYKLFEEPLATIARQEIVNEKDRCWKRNADRARGKALNVMIRLFDDMRVECVILTAKGAKPHGKIFDLSFDDGFWYAVQQITLYKNPADAEFLIIESGLSHQECLSAQARCGLYDEEMYAMIKKVFNQ